MTMERKIEIAKRIYKELGVETEDFQIDKLEDINADIFLPTDNQRGIGGVIIGYDGSYHVCGSIYPLEHYIEEFRNGTRDKIDSDNSLKLSNGKYAADEETKEVFEDYMSKVDKYNEQVANGEKSDVKMGDLLNEYQDTFYDGELEEKQKKIEEEFKNREKDTRIDDLINDINDKLNISSENKTTEKLIKEVDARISNVELQEKDSMGLVPNSLKEYVYFNNGKIYAKQKIPKELEEDYMKLENQINNKSEYMNKITDEYGE